MFNLRFKLLSLLLLSGASLIAQKNDTWTRAVIEDGMTVSPEKNKMWRKGDYGYSSKPKHATEIGVHLGHFHINGDVPSDLPSGFGAGLHLRRAFNYIFSWRVGAMYSCAKGLDGRPTSREVLWLDNTNKSARESLSKYAYGSLLYRNFKSVTYHGNVELIANLGNLLFHKPRNKWNFYAAVGVGLILTDVKLDYLNGDKPYDFSSVAEEENSRAKRIKIKDILDGDYETTIENDRDVEFIFDQGSLLPTFTAALGVSRKINKRFNVTLEHQVWAQDYDKWDGHEYRTTYDQTNDSDIAHYTNVRLGINLGNFDKVTEPLYWLNPVNASLEDITEIKKRPAFDLTDTDGDGIIDLIDQEVRSPAGCPVDTRGVVLDSDADGIADCKDAEPYSPPGFQIDRDGVAIVPVVQQGISESDVNSIIDSKISALNNQISSRPAASSKCGEWFLPMIHFDLDKYFIKPEYYGQLHHVAQVMNICPDMCITVSGHTDSRNTNSYNTVLSFNRANSAIDYMTNNYGIPRSRFKLMYGGEENPLFKNVPEKGGAEAKARQFMNRRVEFRVCRDSDYNMLRPTGPQAGSGSTKSARKSRTYSGNKNSGF